MAAKKKTIRTIPQERTPVEEQDPRSARATSPRFPAATASRTRCARPTAACNAPTSRACAAARSASTFRRSSRKIVDKHYHGAYDIITDTNLLPSICGRVCPQENQCEGVCTVGDTLEPVAIGRLERFVGDMAIKEGWANIPYIEPSGHGSASSARDRPAWRARPTWRRPAATSPSTRRSTSPAASSSTASRTSGCPTR